jgi:glycosyltransferase involved in cell wall biosynthesis
MITNEQSSSLKDLSVSNDMPLVSVLIKNYNYELYLKQAIDSVLSQTYQNIETIVIDDGSTDTSRDIIDSYGDQIIKVYKENGGAASVINAGFSASKGEIICILDSDDFYLPEKIEEVVKVFKSSDEFGWCFHDLRWVNENAELLPEISTQRTASECDIRNRFKSGKLPPPLPASSALCFRRSLFEKIYPLPVAKPVKSSDHYIKYMAAALSKGYFPGKVLAYHRLHGNNAATQRNDRSHLLARKQIYTGIWVKQEFPNLRKFANKLMGVGIALNIKAGNKDMENNKAIREYLSSCSIWDRFQVNSIGIAYYIKNKIQGR